MRQYPILHGLSVIYMIYSHLIHVAYPTLTPEPSSQSFGSLDPLIAPKGMGSLYSIADLTRPERVNLYLCRCDNALLILIVVEMGRDHLGPGRRWSVDSISCLLVSLVVSASAVPCACTGIYVGQSPGSRDATGFSP